MRRSGAMKDFETTKWSLKNFHGEEQADRPFWKSNA